MYQRWRGPRPVVLPPLTARQRMAEFVGSMVVSGLVSLFVALVMILVRGAISGGNPVEPNQYAWLAISAIVVHGAC